MLIEDVVDPFWSGTLGIERDALHRPGVHVVGDAPGLTHDRTFLLRIEDTCVVAVPEHRRSAVEEMIDGRSADEVFDRAFAGRCDLRGGPVLGPAWHGYVDRSSFRPVPPDVPVRRVGGTEADAIERLRSAVAPDEWSEGGFVPLPDATWGSFDGSELVALGNMTDWNGVRSDVGLVTHPAHRGRGLAVAVGSTMVGGTLERTTVVRYRALVTNAASLRVARRLGFIGYGQNIVVRPPS